VNYSVDTLEHFHAEDPVREMFFLMGADMLLDLPNWRRAERVLELALPAAVRRAGSPPLDFSCLRTIASAERIELIRRHEVEMPLMDISGTDLRRLASAGHSLRYRVPPAVEQYIIAHGLYR
jgi:nicotinate-nucleotide adenylyltransferase